MSFALTTRQMEDESKDVTRRLGWRFAEVGMVVQPVRQGQGLKKGEHPIKVRGPIEFTEVWPERLNTITREEVRREGFPGVSPRAFVSMFCEHNGCPRDVIVRRIAFRRVRS